MADTNRYLSVDPRTPEQIRARWDALWFDDHTDTLNADPRTPAEVRANWLRLWWNGQFDDTNRKAG